MKLHTIVMVIATTDSVSGDEVVERLGTQLDPDSFRDPLNEDDIAAIDYKVTGSVSVDSGPADPIAYDDPGVEQYDAWRDAASEKVTKVLEGGHV